MKIYPATHVPQTKETITDRDIPLAYIHATETAVDIAIEPEPDFSRQREIKPVDVYQRFSDENTFFFDNDGNQIHNVPLKSIGTEFMYNPSANEFVPETFLYRCILQRTGSYNHQTNYNMNIGIIDNTIGTDFAESLISIFSNAAKRGLCPDNVIVNNGSETAESLTTGSYKEKDFLFMSSKTGSGSVTIGSDTVSIDDILDNNCNVWLSVQSFDTTLKNAALPVIGTLTEPLLYKNAAYTLTDYPYVFDTTIPMSAYPMSTYEYINLFSGTCPILLLKKKNKGFLIVSETNFLSSLTSNVQLIYEILMRVYLMSYRHTQTRTAWITNDPVHYYLNTQTLFNRCHPVIDLAQIMRSDDIAQPVKLVDVLTSDSVTFKGIDTYARLFFTKTGGSKDPVYSDTVSVYSSSGTILQYDRKNTVINTIEDPVTISYEKTDDGYQITIDPICSSNYKIVTEKQTLTLPDGDDFTLYTAPMESGVETAVCYIVPTASFTSGIRLARIKIIRTLELTTYDLRKLGGGEIGCVNYDMIDTGNILGRPYRLGSALIIKLPKEYKPYADIIREQLELNVSSGECPILVFEGDNA